MANKHGKEGGVARSTTHGESGSAIGGRGEWRWSWYRCTKCGDGNDWGAQRRRRVGRGGWSNFKSSCRPQGMLEWSLMPARRCRCSKLRRWSQLMFCLLAHGGGAQRDGCWKAPRTAWSGAAPTADNDVGRGGEQREEQRRADGMEQFCMYHLR